MDGATVQEARKGLGLSQNQFAGLIGVHPVTISNWERGKAEPTPQQAALIDACVKAAERRPKEIGKLVAAALIGAGIGMALYLLLDAAFGNSSAKDGGPKNGGKQ